MNWLFENVCIESIGYTLPIETWTSAAIEERLAPLYERLKLPAGRLELMSGIAERRFWPRGVLPSTLSAESCRNALRAADFDRQRVGCLMHGSVCRDFLEPATACAVHHHLKLPQQCLVHDVSNACLGILNGVLHAANMIERGQIQSALVVGSEGGRQLVETTIDALNRDTTLTRKSIKDAIASLTIGSASCAWLLAHRSISRTDNRLLGGVCQANTAGYRLCMSLEDQAASDFHPLMATDSHELMVQGIETARNTHRQFLECLQWRADEVTKTICHQVGSVHQRASCEALQVDPSIDFITYPWLGNTGAAALPVTLGIASERGHLRRGDRVGLWGIGSGINCIMLGCLWQQGKVTGSEWDGVSQPPSNPMP